MITCPVCNKEYDESNFLTYFINKNSPQQKLMIYNKSCRKCMQSKISDFTPTTFLPYLKELDIPYFPSEYGFLMVLAAEAGSYKQEQHYTVFMRYVSKMKLKSFQYYGWEDSLEIEKIKIDKCELMFNKK